MGSSRLLNNSAKRDEPVAWVTRGDHFLDVIAARLQEVGRLPPRVAEAINYHVRGWPPDAAARHMRCSLNTYRNHIAMALQRVRAESRSELLRTVAIDLDARPRPLEFEPVVPGSRVLRRWAGGQTR